MCIMHVAGLLLDAANAVKPCINDLCGRHRAQLRCRPGTEPKPCRKCGKGIKSRDPAVFKTLLLQPCEESLSPSRSKGQTPSPCANARTPSSAQAKYQESDYFHESAEGAPNQRPSCVQNFASPTT